METEQQTALAPLNVKVQKILQKETLSPDELEYLTEEERNQFIILAKEQFELLKDKERLAFSNKILPAIEKDQNAREYEKNHGNIIIAISNLMNLNCRMPTLAEIAKEAGLSRHTIRKHFKEYKENPLFRQEEEQFKIMKGIMLAKIFRLASNGDVRAAKLYMEATGMLGNKTTVYKNVIENQNNYIQINETRLFQEQIKKLSPEKLQKLEHILSEWFMAEKTA